LIEYFLVQMPRNGPKRQPRWGKYRVDISPTVERLTPAAEQIRQEVIEEMKERASRWAL
jgi:hypothetical protein